MQKRENTQSLRAKSEMERHKWKKHPNPIKAVSAHVTWRRSDFEPERRGFILVSMDTGRQVENLHVQKFNAEHIDFIFEAIDGPGIYALYYLPTKNPDFLTAKINPSSVPHFPIAYYNWDFPQPDPVWMEHLDLNAKRPQATLIAQEALRVTGPMPDFNRLDSMEVTATSAEMDSLHEKYKDDSFILFGEDRVHSIRMKSTIPARWIGKKPETPLKAERYGFWKDDVPVRCNTKDISLSSYVHTGDKSLIALASWSNKDELVELEIDWQELGLDPENVSVVAPVIDTLQKRVVYNLNQPIKVPAGQGVILEIKRK